MASEQMPRRENNDRIIESEVHVETQGKEPLPDKRRAERVNDKREKERERVSDRARSGNIAKDKEAEEGRRGRESGGGGVQHVRKFETKGDEKEGLGEKAELEGRTKVVVGRELNKEEKQRSRPGGKGEAEKAKPTEKTREEAKGRDKAETKGQTKEGGAEEGKRERESGGGVHHAGKFETKGEEKKGLVEKEKLEKRTREVKGREWNKEEKQRSSPIGKVEAEKARPMEKTQEEAKGREKAETKEGGDEEQGRGREDNEQSSLEEISKYRAEAQQKSFNAIEAAKERYERAKEAASEAAKERNKQAKDVTEEKGQQDKVKAENETREKDQKGYGEAKDTIGTVDHTAPPAEKAKAAGSTTAQYVGEKAAQAKDATVETGKSAAKVAADLRDKAMATGWSAAYYSTEMTVEGTKAATNVVKGAAKYADNKASELAAKSVDTAKGGVVKGEQKPLGNIIGESIQGMQEKGGEVMASIGETLGSAAQTMKKPLDKATEGGREVLGAVGETVIEIGENMVKPAQKVQHQGEGGGVLNAIGETIAEIAETTKVIVAGEGENETVKSYEYEQGELKLD